MARSEQKMIEILHDLKENHGVLGIKAEFEAEGTRIEECMRLKDVISKASLGLTLKIGGCEAIRDMYDARILGVERIVAPMVESDFALKKYCESIKKVFSPEEQQEIFFAINLETKNTYQCFSQIIESPDFQFIDGVVIGRNDLSYSLGNGRDGVNSDGTMEIARDFCLRSKKMRGDLVVGMGGGVSAASIPLFDSISEKLDYFETRKVIFNYKLRNNVDFEIGIMKALQFEILWLQNKQSFYHNISIEDENRINSLVARHSHRMSELGLTI